MNETISDIWVYLARTPLLWLAATLLVYQGAQWLAARAGGNAWLNPVLLSVVALVGILFFTGTPYQVYFDGAQFVHFLLGPATVALAIPLYRYSRKLRSMLLPLLLALLSGAASSVLSVIWIGQLLGLSTTPLRSLLPKSVTTPIAMGISEQVGGLPSLTAVLVICTGIVGAVIGSDLLNLLRIRDQSVCGFAMGLSAHGIGTARAFQLSAEAGAFSGLAMGLNGATSAVLIPLLVSIVAKPV
jgi:predicted murein hydrolase (TIGR00659 family)